jgi:hypothetical protein
VAVGLGGRNSDSEPLSLAGKRVASWQAPKPLKAEVTGKVFKVRVPMGSNAGQQFVAGIPSYGQMLVTVPKGAAVGQVVSFNLGLKVPATGSEIKKRSSRTDSTGLASIREPI